MGHQDKVAKLNRTRSHREAMLANMAMSLFTHRMIKTTDARAKALRPLVDRLIVTAKKDTLASKREVARTVKVKDVFKKLYAEIVPQFSERHSGFTRVIKLGVRRGDGALMSVVELLTAKPVESEDSKDKKGKKKAKAGSKPLKAAKTAKASKSSGSKKQKAAK
jgi:large subunit ribosomal protein L17